MHPFITKVVAAAVFITLVGAASATSARADVAVLLGSSWYTTYDRTQHGHVHGYPAPTARVIIHTGNLDHGHRHKAKRPLAKADGAIWRSNSRQFRSFSKEPPRRRTVHSSGYNW